MWKVVVIFISLHCLAEALKCKNMDGGEVDWWFFVKPPKVKNVLYADSANPKDAFKTKHPAEGLFETNYHEPTTIFDKIEHITGKREVPASVVWNALSNTDRATITSSIEIINYWFNDQPNPKGDTNDRARYKTNAADSQEYKFAHSKYLLSYNLTAMNGYLLEHSFPSIPADARLPVDIFPEKDVFKFSQHAFCLSFAGETQLEAILDAIIWSRGRLVVLNFPPYMLPSTFALSAKFQTAINGDQGVAQGQMCIAEWNKKLPSGPLIDKEKKKLLRLDPLSECFLNVNLGINNIKVFSHAKGEIEATEDQQTSVKKDALTSAKATNADIDRAYHKGQWPWMNVAKELDTHLLIDTWSNVDLPSVIFEDFGLLMVEWIGFSQEHVWKHGNGHEKIAIDVDKKYLCFGDGNHRVSEITHAGLTICLENADLASIFYDAVLMVIDKNEYMDWRVNKGKLLPANLQTVLDRSEQLTKDSAKTGLRVKFPATPGKRGRKKNNWNKRKNNKEKKKEEKLAEELRLAKTNPYTHAKKKKANEPLFTELLTW